MPGREFTLFQLDQHAIEVMRNTLRIYGAHACHHVLQHGFYGDGANDITRNIVEPVLREFEAEVKPPEVTQKLTFRKLGEEDFRTLEKSIAKELWLEMGCSEQRSAEFSSLAVRIFRRYLLNPGPHLTERDGSDRSKPVGET